MFYESEFGGKTSGGSTTVPQVSLTLSSLEPDVSYTAFVVAFGGDLPSAHSNTADIPAGKIDCDNLQCTLHEHDNESSQ